MKNKELFNDTVRILVNAYLNNSLVQGNCHACAVGNIIAAKMNIKYDQDLKWMGCQVAWPQVFVTVSFEIAQVRRPWNLNGPAKEQINATGYSWKELAQIEYAFERAPWAKTQEERMFNGLMAVVEALSQIHEMDENTKSATKGLFLKD